MTWFGTLLSGFANTHPRRAIATAPFDREIELDLSCIRQGDGWLDTESLKPSTSLRNIGDSGRLRFFRSVVSRGDLCAGR
jgi:hypothetical protein